jgi:hypothetical protein
MPMGIVSDADFQSELSRLTIKSSKPLAEGRVLEDDGNIGEIIIPTAPVSPEFNENKTNQNEEAEVIDILKGRGNTNEVPQILREIIAKSAINNEGSGAEIARAFDVSESSVSAYKVGATSTASYNEPDENLLSTVLGHRQKISKQARNKLLNALEHLTTDKLKGVKARDLSAIAKDMSAIITDMEPPIPTNVGNQQNIQFVFMAPRVQSEENYAVIDVDN